MGLLVLFAAPVALAILAYFFGAETRPGFNEDGAQDTASNNVPLPRQSTR